MKSLISTLSLMLVFAFGSCTGEAAMSPESMLNKAKDAFSTVTTKLGDVKDAETAKTAETAIAPMLKTITGLGGKLGALKSMGSIGDMLSKFKMGSVFDGIKNKISGMVTGGNEHVKPLASKAMDAFKSFMGNK